MEGGLLDVSDGAIEKAWQQYYLELEAIIITAVALDGLSEGSTSLDFVMFNDFKSGGHY